MQRFAALALPLLLLAAPRPAGALFHISQIDEVMSGAGGDANAQYVQIRLLAGAQNFVQNARVTFFGCAAGNPATVLKLIDKNLANGMAGTRWLLATSDPIGGIHPDFVFSPAIDRACGMLCWGAPVQPNFMAPADPTSWSADDPNQYVDCWAYGGYAGKTKTGATQTTPQTAGDGTHALTRAGAGLALACPAPTNDAGDVGSLGGCTATPTTTTPGSTPTTTSTTVPGGTGGAPGCADAQAAATVRAAIAAQCPCATATAHHAYVKCAARVVAQAIKAKTLPRACKASLTTCAARSTCGRSGAVACCRTTASGSRKCVVKKSAAACKPPRGGAECASNQQSCCDACLGADCPAPASSRAPAPHPVPTIPGY